MSTVRALSVATIEGTWFGMFDVSYIPVHHTKCIPLVPPIKFRPCQSRYTLEM